MAKQHRFQAEAIAAVVGQLSSILQTFCKKSLHDKFLSSYVKQKKFKPGTTKSYLSILVHFSSYLLSAEDVPEIGKCHIRHMLS